MVSSSEAVIQVHSEVPTAHSGGSGGGHRVALGTVHVFTEQFYPSKISVRFTGYGYNFLLNKFTGTYFLGRKTVQVKFLLLMPSLLHILVNWFLVDSYQSQLSSLFIFIKNPHLSDLF